MVLVHVLIYVLSFFTIWFGAGLIISSVDTFSKKLRFSSFALSFVILGILTSTPEFAVGLTAISDNNPEVFVGNLLGGIPVIFLFIIPLLAVLGNGINLKHKLDQPTLLASLCVIAAPSFLSLDRRISISEGMLLIILYVVLLLLVQRSNGFFDKQKNHIFSKKSYSPIDLFRIFIGVGIVFISSNIIVDQTLYLSKALDISLFYISLIALALGTNLPELSLAIRSVFSGKKDVAFGDYMGSAAANTLLFGVFTLLSNGNVVTTNNFLVTFIFIVMSVSLFYFYSRSNSQISRKEGFILLVLYFVFVYIEFL